MGWELQFWESDTGREPVREWLDALDDVKQAAAVRGLSIVLADFGPDVCQSEYGKSLGGGLFEFRLRHSAKEIIAKHRPSLLEQIKLVPPDGSVLLRIFFHPHGDQVILLLGGYDKGRFTGSTRQQREIKAARKRLGEWERRQDKTANDFRPWWARYVNRLRGR